MWRVGFGLMIAVGVSGCFDKQAASSGQIGCSPDEVVISDEESGYSSKTWTATCGKEQYFCSLVATGKETGQVSCRAASKPAPSAPKPVDPDGVADSEAPPAVKQEPPASVAGFAFGSSLADASTACTGHSFEWQPAAQDHYRCSGAPVSIGLDSVPTVRFCNDKLCAVSLDVTSPNAWLTAYAQINDALAKKYGRPAFSKGQPRSNCAGEANFEACIMNDGLELVRDWKWPAARISLRLAAGASAPEMKIVYVRQAQREVVPGAL
jgi:hypothetical protein